MTSVTRKPPDKTASERKRRQYKRWRDEGWVPVTVWVPRDRVAAVKAAAKRK